METLQLVVLALIQGITEFLPISSSGHLALIPAVSGWEDQGPVMDVAVHVGTLVAVLLYFRRDTVGLTCAGLGSVGIKPARRVAEQTGHFALFWALVLATLPTLGVGAALKLSGAMESLRTPTVIASASILFGVLLYGADRWCIRVRDLREMKLKPALLIGLAQILALIPGASRAGVTMTAGRALGFTRVDAARFSMLLSIPTILGAGVLTGLDLNMSGASIDLWVELGMGAGLACLAALAAIHFFMGWLQHASMTVFVVYRIALGVALLGAVGLGWL